MLAHGKQLYKIPIDLVVELIDIIDKIITVIMGKIISLTIVVNKIDLKRDGHIINFNPAPTLSIPIAKAESDKLAIVL